MSQLERHDVRRGGGCTAAAGPDQIVAELPTIMGCPTIFMALVNAVFCRGSSRIVIESVMGCSDSRECFYSAAPIQRGSLWHLDASWDNIDLGRL